MRTDLLDAIATQVNGYHLRPELDYDYQNVRRRLIFEALTQGVQYVCNNAVEGDIAEFGTASGFTAYTMARALGIYQQMYAGYLRQQRVPRKSLVLFDSFQGLPTPDHPVDTASPYVQVGRWQEGTFTALSPTELHALCGSAYDPDGVRVVEGWFKDTLPGLAPPARIAMAHLDCDLYSSTAEVLERLFSQRLMAEGSVLFFDDWNCNRSSPSFGQRRAWRETVQKYGVVHSDCGDYAVLGHKFIVHVDA